MEAKKNPNTKLLNEDDTAMMVLEKLPNPIIVINPDSSIRYINTALTKLTGFTSQALIGKKTPYPFWLEAKKISTMSELQTAMKKGAMGLEENFQKKNGDSFWVGITSTPVMHNDELKYYIANWVDITARKRAEKEILDSHRFINHVFNSIQDGISVLDKDLTILRTNVWMEKMYKDHLPLTGKKCYNVYQKRKTVCPWCPSVKSLKDGKLHTEIVPYPDEEDPSGWIELSSYPLLDNNNNIYGVIEHVKDISEHKKADDRILHLNRLLRGIRDVNQLIVREKDPMLLIKESCEILTRDEGYFSTWIVLFDEKGNYTCSAESGLGKKFDPIRAQMKAGKMTKCARKAFEINDLVILNDPAKECPECPLSKNYSGRCAFTIPISHKDKIYGLLAVSAPGQYADDEEERDLLLEVSHDIAFALHDIYLLRQEKQLLGELTISQSTLRGVIDSTGEAMLVVGTDRKVLAFNSNLQKMWHFPNEVLETRDDYKYIEHVLPLVKEKKRVISKSKELFASKREDMFTLTTNDERFIEVYAFPLMLEGKLAGRVWCFREITQRKQTEEALKKKMHELEIFNEAAVGRELKINEHRKEINELLKRLGEEPKYNIVL